MSARSIMHGRVLNSFEVDGGVCVYINTGTFITVPCAKEHAASIMAQYPKGASIALTLEREDTP